MKTKQSSSATGFQVMLYDFVLFFLPTQVSLNPNMMRSMAEMATLKKQNKRLQDKMAQLRQLCDKQQAASKTTLEVRTVTGVFNHYSYGDAFAFVLLPSTVKRLSLHR